jgi:hypothetical protein
MSDENFRPFSATLAAIVVVILGSVSPEIHITMDARCMVVVHGSCGNGQMIDSSQGEKDLMHGAATPSVPKKDSVDSSARPVPSQADEPRKGKKPRKPNRRLHPVFTDRNNCRYG